MPVTEVPHGLQEQYGPDLSEQMSGLGMWLRDRFEDVKSKRLSTEQEWLKDLRQFKGIYETEEWQRLSGGKYRSRLFSKMTRRKVRAFDSRMMEMLFPAGKDRNWSIRHSPEPDVIMTPAAQTLLQQEQMKVMDADVQRLSQESGEPPEQIVQKLQAGGYEPEVSQQQLNEIQLAVAKAAATRMENAIADQLELVHYKRICGKALHSGHKYGTGILKGPLLEVISRPKWVFQEGQWAQVFEKQLTPYVEYVPVWSWYPDAAAKDPMSLEFSFQRHLMLKSQVADLARMPGFDADLIRTYLTNFPDGDAQQLSWETEVDAEDERNHSEESRSIRRYEVLEYWGVLNDAFLRDLGLEPDPLKSPWLHIWVIGHFVIKVGRTPLTGMDHLYHLYYFEEDETSVWGSSVPSIMRDDQHALNSTVRAMMDNVASTVGPQWEVNTDYLHPGERSRDIYANRVWYRRGDGRNPAIRAVEVSSRLNEFLGLKQTFETQIHENTLPAYMQGGSAGSGAGRTASGLSMLMGSANLDVKDQITAFDLGITRSLIKGMYLWNMQFNDDDDLKGDYEVVARGSSSLVAKEIRTQQLDQLLPLLMNPVYADYVDQRKLLDEIFKARDMLDSEILLRPEEYDERKRLKEQLADLQQRLAKSMKLMDELWKLAPTLVRQALDRIPPDQIEQHRQQQANTR